MTEAANNVVRMRGLPWSATEEDVKKFFDPIGNNIVRISFTLNSNGRKSGEAYVEFQTEANLRLALSKNNLEMGKRYIEVFAATKAEMDYVTSHTGAKQKKISAGGRKDLIVRLRGLPYGCSEDDIEKFFSGLQLAPHGILFIYDERGRQSGECYVKFSSADDFETALEKDKDTIGHRYIEVFPSSYAEAEKSLKKHDADFNPGPQYGSRHGPPGAFGRTSLMQPLFDDWPSMSDGYGPKQRRYGGMDVYSERFSPYNPNNYTVRGGGYGVRGGPAGIGGGGGGGGVMKGVGGSSSNAFFERRVGNANSTSTKNSVTVRGLPYNCGLNDIVELFHPIKIAGLSFIFDDEGRPTGEASVQFSNPDDAAQAQDRNGAQIGGRYVDIYFNFEPEDHPTPSYPHQGANAPWLPNNGGNDFFSFGE